MLNVESGMSNLAVSLLEEACRAKFPIAPLTEIPKEALQNLKIRVAEGSLRLYNGNTNWTVHEVTISRVLSASPIVDPFKSDRTSYDDFKARRLAETRKAVSDAVRAGDKRAELEALRTLQSLEATDNAYAVSLVVSPRSSGSTSFFPFSDRRTGWRLDSARGLNGGGG